MQRIRSASIVLLTTVTLLATGCAETRSRGGAGPEALALATAAHPGDTPLDRQIRQLQERVVGAGDPLPILDRLGWAFVEKARLESDPGYYHLAERCAEAMAELGGDGPEAWLLRGHALHSLHRFDEAERVARALVDARGLPFDHALLGDVLLDRGDLDGAVAAYQRMADLRPDSHALVRAARVRFLTGDVTGAAEMARAAARATSPRNGETFAWTWAQLATVQLELGDFAAASHYADVALAVQPNSAPALYAQGRVLLARGRAHEAIEPLRAAARRNPLPDVLWTLAEALAAAGHSEDEAAVRARLRATGSGTDPRGFSLYLASHGLEPVRALELAQDEIARRRDVYTLDALAWAQAQNGQIEAARTTMQRALAAGTRDARLFYHAGVIAAAAGAADEAALWFTKATSLGHTLLPSQRADLEARIDSARTTTASS